MKKHTFLNYNFISDEDFQLYLSETLMSEYGRTSDIPRNKYFKTLSACARAWLKKLNKPRTVNDLVE